MQICWEQLQPKAKDVIYARTDIGGAYRYEPATGSWTQLLAWVGFDDWNWTGCESIATDPVDPQRVHLAVGTYTNDWASTNGAILRSTDQGKTFQRTDLPFKLGSNMPGRNMGERLVIDPNQNRILYLGARSGNGLWKSTDYGVTWAKVTSNSWNAAFTQNGAAVTVQNVAYNSTIPANGTVSFGFNLSYSGTNAKPTSFTLNGTTCQVQ